MVNTVEFLNDRLAMVEDRVLRWEPQDLEGEEPSDLLEEIVDSEDRRRILLVEGDDLQQAIDFLQKPTAEETATPANPRFAEAVDPAVVIAFVEGAFLIKEVRKVGVVTRTRIEERLRRRGESVEQLYLGDFS